MNPTDAENRESVAAVMNRHQPGGPITGTRNIGTVRRGLSYNSSSADEIRALVHAIDLDGKWPTPRKARERGMRADNRRFVVIRDAMFLDGEIKTLPPKFIAWPPEKRREFLHSPGRVPEPEKPKGDETPWRPLWARGRTETDPPLADAVALSLRSFFEYRRAWQRMTMGTWPVDLFRQIVPIVRRKKRKKVEG